MGIDPFARSKASRGCPDVRSSRQTATVCHNTHAKRVSGPIWAQTISDVGPRLHAGARREQRQEIIELRHRAPPLGDESVEVDRRCAADRSTHGSQTLFERPGHAERTPTDCRRQLQRGEHIRKRPSHRFLQIREALI